MSESMNCFISVKICDNGKEVYSACKTAQEMKDAGYQQPQLQTDEVPLEPLKENEVFYLAAAVEKMKEDVGMFLSQRIESNSNVDTNHQSKKQKVDEESFSS